MIQTICFVNLPRNEYLPSIPLGLLSLSACLENTSYNVKIIDFDLIHKRGEITCDDTFWDRAVQIVTATDSDIVGITADCANYPAAMEFIRCLKRAAREVTIILGGPQASLVALETLAAIPEIDFIVVGEGEITLLNLLDALSNNLNPMDVNGIAFRNGDRVYASPSRELMVDLNDLPFPLFKKYPVQHYSELFPQKGIQPTLPIEVGRGCPKNCYYCATAKMWMKKCRYKSPERLFKEMSLLAKDFGITFFEFIHDNITFNNNFIREFCEYLSERKAPFTWNCSASTDYLSRNLLEKMARSGCTGILLGIESGSERMQKIMGKNLSTEHSDQIVKICNDLGIHVVASFILGFPEETKRDLDLTIRKAIEYSLEGVEIRIGQLSIFPGTSLYEHYFNQLELRQTSPNACFIFYEFIGQRNLIKNFPNIFSSFYTLPPIHYSDIDLSTLLFFSDVMINHYAQAFENVLQAVRSIGDGPVEIFQEWNHWWKNYRPQDDPNRNLIYSTFDIFLDSYSEKVFERRKVSRVN